jgi:ribulose 1,5-bisphosphate synthetase/thiazole synthase
MSSIPRRTLLKMAGTAAAAGLARPLSLPSAQGAEPPTRIAPHGMQIDLAQRTVLEAPRRTRVAADVDVLVVGGGPTGVGAALAAAREGARTLVVERHGMLGGVWTAGLLNPLFDFHRKGWIVAELVERLKKAQAWQAWKFSHCFDIEAMKLLLESMAAEAKAASWYYSFAADAIVEQGRLRGVIVESKSGREAVLAKVVVDCTGDGDVAARAGVPYRLGRLGDSMCQPMTLMFEVQGVDGYLQTNTGDLYDQMTAAIARHKLAVKLPFGRVNYAPWIINVPRAGAADVQATHVYQMNPLDTRDLTRATIEARRQADALVQVMRRVPGLENMRLVQTAPAIGVREARHLAGRYQLNLEDLKAGRRFDDAVTFCGFGVDIHDVKQGDRSAHGTKIRTYQIPYRCLVPEALAGLLFAGRCISGTHEAHASYRVTGTCMAMGQAAGLAAAMAAAENKSPDQLDGPSLRKALEQRGAGLA